MHVAAFIGELQHFKSLVVGEAGGQGNTLNKIEWEGVRVKYSVGLVMRH